MWLLCNDGLVSVVSDLHNPDRLLVRARRKEDLLNVCGIGTEVIENAGTDYRFRTFVDRKAFAGQVAERIEAINYPNFKASVVNADLHELYMRVWQLHYEYQEQGRKAERKEARQHRRA